MRRRAHTSRKPLLTAVLLYGLCAATACSATPSYETQVGQAARRLAAAADAAKLPSVAVVDFTTLEGRRDALGRFLAIDLGARLRAPGSRFTLCDRDSLEQVLEEHKLESTGLVDPEQVAEVGRGCGAAGIVFGRHSRQGDTVVVQVRLIDVESLEVVATADLRFPDSPGFDELRRRAVPLPGSGGHSTAPARNLPQTALLGDVEVTLDACTFRQYQLLCDLRVTNRSDGEVRVEVLDTTHLVDNQNDEHEPSRVWLDRKPSGKDRKVATTLAAHGTVPLEVELRSVPRRKKKAQLLQVDLRGAGAARFLDFAFDRDEL